MARIPNNELDRLKREVALVRLVESSGIELKKHGKDYLGSVSYTHLRAHETDCNLVCRLLLEKNLFLMIRRPPRSTLTASSAASDVYKRQYLSGVFNRHKPVPRIGNQKKMQSVLRSHLAWTTRLLWAQVLAVPLPWMWVYLWVSSCLLYTSPSPRDRL